MSASEKIKANIEQMIGKVVRKAAHALGNETTAAKGAALQARGKGRHLKETGKDAFKL
ncbi:hypothetical protein ACFXD5_33505 [Streptomyces sp. NPDC059385]|uniref:CsbD family protein n=1 Tax=Streptomyces sp. NPDC059385 TaxID=3346817 RepID=UPI0036CCF290